MSPPTTNARALFAAARDDGPESAERDAVFRKIALSTGIAAGTAAGATVLSLVPAASATTVAAAAAKASTSAGTVATTAAAAPVAFAVGSKLLALGVALGAVSTALGVVVAVSMGAPEAAVAPRAAARTANVVTPATPSPGAKLAQPVARKRDTTSAALELDSDATLDANAHAASANAASANAHANANANAVSAKPGPKPAANVASSGGDLAEEARLVTAARRALVAGDASRALSLVQATRKLGSRSLEPEELGLEARALRALGRTDEAAATELALRRRYPDHALAR